MERKRKYARAGMWNDRIQSPFLLFVEGEKPVHISRMQFVAYCRVSGGKQWISKRDGNGNMRDYYIAGDTDLYWDQVYEKADEPIRFAKPQKVADITLKLTYGGHIEPMLDPNPDVLEDW